MKIDCAKHGPGQHAYFVCSHLLESRDPKEIGSHKLWRERWPGSPFRGGAGELYCTREHQLDSIRLVCQEDLIEMGLLQVDLAAPRLIERASAWLRRIGAS